MARTFAYDFPPTPYETNRNYRGDDDDHMYSNPYTSMANPSEQSVFSAERRTSSVGSQYYSYVEASGNDPINDPPSSISPSSDHAHDDDEPSGGEHAMHTSLWEEEDRTPSLISAATALLSPLPDFFRGENGRLGIALVVMVAGLWFLRGHSSGEAADIRRPEYVYHHPYVSSSYYSSTRSLKTLKDTERLQVKRVGGNPALSNRKFKTNLAIVRPFCEFDAEALPTTFDVWNQLTPCRVSLGDLDLSDENVTSAIDKEYFDDVGGDLMKDMAADVFLFYSQTFSENEVAIEAVDTILDQFNEPGGWSQCFRNIYAIEANIPQELDLYIPSAQEELYNWVNGPNRQFEAGFRIIQSGEWGDYDGFYLMEGDSVPVKNHWLDVILSEIEANRPFATLGAKYNGDKWDNFYEQIPLGLIHHINGNAIYNTSHPLMERLVGQLEVEAPCPYNSLPYDYRMSQMMVEGALGVVPELAPKIMLNEEGENITLSNNTEMFSKWWDMHKHETPFKETPAIHNYAATNLIPRHIGPEYVIHGAKLYAPWNPAITEITLVVSEWHFDRSANLLGSLDEKDHPFSDVVVMLPPIIEAHDDYWNMTVVPTRAQHRVDPDYMDLCEAEVSTEWFMMTNSYHQVAAHVDLMFTPGKFQPVVPFTPATYPFCFKFPYCKENVNLAQRFNPGHEKVVLDFDVLYHTETRNAFCKEWKKRFGHEGQRLYKGRRKMKVKEGKIIGPPGPTGTSYVAYVFREKKEGMYKFTDRSLYGARDAFIKVFAKEEKMDGMSDEERGMLELQNRNLTNVDCNCKAFQTQAECENSPLGCIWRPLFESCHPPEMIDGGVPICPTTEAPTMAPTEYDPLDDTEAPSAAPTKAPQSYPWYAAVFKAGEHDRELAREKEAEESQHEDLDIYAVEDEEEEETVTLDDLYEDTNSTVDDDEVTTEEDSPAVKS